MRRGPIIATSRRHHDDALRPGLILSLVCFVVVGLYALVTPFSKAWNVGRVAGLALFAAAGLMRVRHDRKGTTPVTRTAVIPGLDNAHRARATARSIWALERMIGAPLRNGGPRLLANAESAIRTLAFWNTGRAA